MTYADQAYTEASVMSASPEQLIVLLYDGAIKFLQQAEAAYGLGQTEIGRDKIRRAERILTELQSSLDMDQGEVAQRLQDIYLFAKTQILSVLISKDTQTLRQVADLLGELREAWSTIADQAQAAS